jgi:hypothetical protein
VELENLPREKSIVRKPRMWPQYNQIDCNRNDWEKSIKEAKVRIGM